MSIRTMPSAPKAEEIATEVPKVSKDQRRARSGLQASAVVCSCWIRSFMKAVPLDWAVRGPRNFAQARSQTRFPSRGRMLLVYQGDRRTSRPRQRRVTLEPRVLAIDGVARL